MSSIILLAETGSDITPELAKDLNVRLVPMHVSLGDVTLDDGSFPAEDVHSYYEHRPSVWNFSYRLSFLPFGQGPLRHNKGDLGQSFVTKWWI